MSAMSDADLDERPTDGAAPQRGPPRGGGAEGDGAGEPLSTTSSTLTTADRLGALLDRARRLLPWFSLAFGLIGALLMDRSPKSAWLVIAMAVLGWGAIIGFTFLARLDPATTGSAAPSMHSCRLAAQNPPPG